MAKRNVIWTKTADMQFVSILGYWMERNKSNTYSKKLVNLVTERTNQIAETPFIFKATDFNGVRIASLGNFSIYYKVTEISIIISAFWDNRQDPKKLLKILQNEK
jgi:toxin YoeB